MTAGSTAVHLDAASTSVLAASGGGVLHTVTVGTAGSSGALVTLHDGPDSTHRVIAVIDASGVCALTLDAVLSAGLTAVVAGSPDAPDVTVTVLPAQFEEVYSRI